MRIGYLIPGLSGSVGNGGGGGGSADSRIDERVNGTILEYSGDVTSVTKYAFSYCGRLQAVSMPNATSIDGYAFSNCTSLWDVNLPKATVLANDVFRGCSALVDISLPAAIGLSTDVFTNCIRLKTAYIPSMTDIGPRAFSGCPNLESVEIGGTSVCRLGATNVFSNTKIASGTGFIYVPDDLVESYKTASNWSTYANQIKPVSEKPEV